MNDLDDIISSPPKKNLGILPNRSVDSNDLLFPGKVIYLQFIGFRTLLLQVIITTATTTSATTSS